MSRAKGCRFVIPGTEAGPTAQDHQVTYTVPVQYHMKPLPMERC